jgi:hypothetical protein
MIVNEDELTEQEKEGEISDTKEGGRTTDSTEKWSIAAALPSGDTDGVLVIEEEEGSLQRSIPSAFNQLTRLIKGHFVINYKESVTAPDDVNLNGKAQAKQSMLHF